VLGNDVFKARNGGCMATLKQRRVADRIRQKRWRENQRNQGKKQVSAMISLKAQIILNREKRRTRSTTSEVIEKAVLLLNEASEIGNS
jgi:hypothetical protein